MRKVGIIIILALLVLVGTAYATTEGVFSHHKYDDPDTIDWMEVHTQRSGGGQYVDILWDYDDNTSLVSDSPVTYYNLMYKKVGDKYNVTRVDYYIPFSGKARFIMCSGKDFSRGGTNYFVCTHGNVTDKNEEGHANSTEHIHVLDNVYEFGDAGNGDTSVVYERVDFKVTGEYKFKVRTCAESNGNDCGGWKSKTKVVPRSWTFDEADLLPPTPTPTP